MKEMTTKEVQQMSLEILKDVHDFCVKNNIRYSLSGGTLLGAIRHNGFIPWDDDVDIQLPRPDFDRLVREYKSEKGFKIFYSELDGCESMTYNHARVCDVERTLIDGGIVSSMPLNVGVWIDILPCDGISSDYSEAERHLKTVDYYVYLSYIYGVKLNKLSNITKGRNILSKIKFIGKKFLSLLILKNPLPKYRELRKRYDYQSSEYFFCTTHYGMREYQPKSYLESFSLHKFEDYEFYVMNGYDANLKSLYGDYMVLPPEDRRVTHDYNHYYWKD